MYNVFYILTFDMPRIVLPMIKYNAEYNLSIINQISIPLYSRRNFIMFSLEKIWFGINYGLQDPICDIIASLGFSLTFYNLSCGCSLIMIFIKNKHINEEPQQQKKFSGSFAFGLFRVRSPAFPSVSFTNDLFVQYLQEDETKLKFCLHFNPNCIKE